MPDGAEKVQPSGVASAVTQMGSAGNKADAQLCLIVRLLAYRQLRRNRWGLCPEVVIPVSYFVVSKLSRQQPARRPQFVVFAITHLHIGGPMRFDQHGPHA